MNKWLDRSAWWFYEKPWSGRECFAVGAVIYAAFWVCMIAGWR